MARRVSDALAQRSTDTFVGRAEELAVLLQSLERDGPLVVHVQGIAGIGKSSLVHAFSSRARARRATVVRLDCHAIEPTERGFLRELAVAIGSDAATREKVVRRLGRLGRRVVLALDTYEVFRLMDTWLRQVFVPALSDNVRVMLFGRAPPVSAWLTSAGWQGLFRGMTLGPLGEREAIECLWRLGVRKQDARRINRFARGHPLALKLAASLASERPDLDLEEVAIPRVVEELTRTYLADVQDSLTRQALDAASVVRRTTLPLLRAMLPASAPQDAHERLRALPFVERGRDGLIVHDAVQPAIAATLRAADPSRYRAYRRAAWQHLRAEVRTAGSPDLWRYTADILYLIENPVVREAFFPSGVNLFAVEPARPEDGRAFHAISKRHEGPRGVKALDAWWARAPQCFHAVRARDGTVAGFYCMADADAIRPALLRDDPVVQRWWTYLGKDPVPRDQQVLFLRRWLGEEHGEAPSPVQAACWLDIKRTYMERRPHLRRVFTTVRDLPTYAPVVRKLGFQAIAEAGVELDGAIYHAAMLDFGPLSVDGWLTALVAAELGVEEEAILDMDARELVVGSRRIGLTAREFAVLHYLWQREGKVVTRMSLLEDVWEPDYEGGSNVADVVVRSLRRKLADRASMIETVRGAGYRFRRG
ncbi:MAG: winged helix-turn-helix domain-containing protein [Candidatus Methylomirabilia bacterium]